MEPTIQIRDTQCNYLPLQRNKTWNIEQSLDNTIQGYCTLPSPPPPTPLPPPPPPPSIRRFYCNTQQTTHSKQHTANNTHKQHFMQQRNNQSPNKINNTVTVTAHSTNYSNSTLTYSSCSYARNTHFDMRNHKHLLRLQKLIPCCFIIMWYEICVRRKQVQSLHTQQLMRWLHNHSLSYKTLQNNVRNFCAQQ